MPFFCNIAMIIAVEYLCKTALLVIVLLIIVLGKLKYQTNKTKRQKKSQNIEKGHLLW